MKKSIIALLLIFSLTSCDEIIDVLGSGTGGGTGISISQGEASSGLKQALEKGVLSGVSSLGQNGGFLKNAAYKILLPPEVRNVESKIRGNVLANALAGPYLDKVVTAMNTGSEKAMAEAKPIFVNAIKSMTITDAINIVTGGNGAGTSYLQRTTESQLKGKFKPVIGKALDNVNLRDPWKKVSTGYNMVTGNNVATNIDDYVTGKATTALFSQVRKEEDKIRANPIARTTEILKKVFGFADSRK